MTDRVFIIAEAGVNHDGSLDDAVRMVDVAADVGADAVKFQTFDAAQLVTRRAAKAAYQARNTGEDGGQLGMLRALELDRDAHHRLAAHAAERGVRFMSTAFDLDSLAFLTTLDMPAVKIPSGDLTWGAMLLEASRLGPPLIVSTGMANLEEIRTALSVIAFGLTQEGLPRDGTELEAAFADPAAQARLRERVTLLHCTTEYPAPLAAVNLRAMDLMAETFSFVVLSFHKSDNWATVRSPVCTDDTSLASITGLHGLGGIKRFGHSASTPSLMSPWVAMTIPAPMIRPRAKRSQPSWVIGPLR